MTSFRTRVVKYSLRKMNVFGGDRFDVKHLRRQAAVASKIFRTHRKVKVCIVDAGGVPSEWLIPDQSSAEKVLLYMHGGGFMSGSSKTHRPFVSKIAYLSRTCALSINYRLAPENPFPAGLDDCITAYRWLLLSGFSPDKIIVAGDSSGGNLALALLVALRDGGDPLPAGAIGISPNTDLALTGASYNTRADVDLFFGRATTKIQAVVSNYIGDCDPKHPLISPLYADLNGLPHLLLHVGDHEILLDDAVRFADRARKAGVTVSFTAWPEMMHDFQLSETFIPEAHDAIDEIVHFIREHQQ